LALGGWTPLHLLVSSAPITHSVTLAPVNPALIPACITDSDTPAVSRLVHIKDSEPTSLRQLHVLVKSIFKIFLCIIDSGIIAALKPITCTRPVFYELFSYLLNVCLNPQYAHKSTHL